MLDCFDVNNIEFNQNLAELMLKNCSLTGNQDEILLVLSRMKQHDLLLNENVFVSLILAKGKQRYVL